MSKIHPSDRSGGGGGGARRAAVLADQQRRPQVYTVWKRSSMGFQGTDGFCVYDAAGGLAFRVDNYSRRPKAFAGELTLMDGRGAPLLSLRPQILSLRDRWNCYRVGPGAGEDQGCSADVKSSSSSVPPQQLFSMRKCTALQNSDEAEVYMSAAQAPPPPASSSSSTTTTTGPSCRIRRQAPPPSFRIEGCFARRSCKISGSDGQEAARISRKKSSSTTSAAASTASRPSGVSLGDDVFSLVVRPGVDAATVMAIVVVMDRISRKPYAPLTCSAQ